MKRSMLMLVMVFLLAACSAAPSAPADTSPAAANADLQPAAAETTQIPSSVESIAAGDWESIIVTDYEDATNLRNQLAYGTILLEGTQWAVTPAQAQALLPLWQAMSALSGEATTVSEELNALQVQIAETLTAEQIQTIAAIKITNSQITGYFESMGIVMPTPVPGETRVPGAMRDLAPEVRAATQAARQAAGGEGAGMGQLSKTLLYDEVIKLLSQRAVE